MKVKPDNCKYCPELSEGKCDGSATDCICRRCPRNLGKCTITKYCSETESVLYL